MWKSISHFSGILKGYVCFLVSILVIGIVTAVIGDVASHFGATLGIADSVTAIVFVALGTSIPVTSLSTNSIRDTSNLLLYFCYSLAFSVTIFCSGAAITIIVLLIRRSKSIGGELGGPTVPKYITSAFLFFIWLMYLLLSTLEVYNVIKGF
ncbi:sodium/calcium exchanger [Holotrichia oblita]|uniref:Sodium/calcium exchanger n=1 Tax=Holotrichia oblita TaxID=644536 RepID=A0ACB9TPD1_HOLOL|nr:sodium/calcium exchanger [Holotrichia oblita]